MFQVWTNYSWRRPSTGDGDERSLACSPCTGRLLGATLIHRSAWKGYSPKLTRTLLRRSESPTGELTEPPVASNETRGPLIPRLARSVTPIGAAHSTPLRTLRSHG